MKRTIAFALTAVMMLICFVTTAYAANDDFVFYMTSGGDSDYSDLL